MYNDFMGEMCLVVPAISYCVLKATWRARMWQSPHLFSPFYYLPDSTSSFCRVPLVVEGSLCVVALGSGLVVADVLCICQDFVSSCDHFLVQVDVSYVPRVVWYGDLWKLSAI